VANIFTTEPGLTIAINDPRILPLTIVLEGWGGYPVRNAIITGFSASSEGNLQFLNTLRNFTYVYVFGEKMGDIIISGQTLLGRCGSSLFSGTSRTINYYAFNAASWIGRPLYIAIGASFFYGFLTGVEVGMRNPEARIGNFTLKYKSIATT